MLEKMEFEEETIERSFTLLGGGESSTMWHPKKEPNDTQKKKKYWKKLCMPKRIKGTMQRNTVLLIKQSERSTLCASLLVTIQFLT
jgi:hypothetical protein